MNPHLTASLTGPLKELQARILEDNTTVEHWFGGHWQEHTPPGEGSNRFYAHGVIARLSPAAASVELERTAPAE